MLPIKVLFVVKLMFEFVILVNGQDLNENEKYLLYKIQQLEQHFQRNVTDLLKEINELRDQANKNSNACENGWFAYLDQKCIKALEKKGTVEEGVKACVGVDKQANLLSIHSEYEMKFLSQHLEKYNDISDNAWIGLKFSGKGFQWFDKTELNYQHWDEDAIKDGKLPCVQMSLGKSSLGKWRDENCERKNLIVCQRKQSTLTVVSGDLQNLTRVVDEQQAQIIEQKAVIEKYKNLLTQQGINFNNTMNSNKITQQNNLANLQKQLTNVISNPIPIGFIYVQMPNEKTPGEIWPGLKWQEVSANFAGVFFRVNGGQSAQFGKVQEENIPRITQIEGSGQNQLNWNSIKAQVIPNTYTRQFKLNIPNGGHSQWFYSGGFGSSNSNNIQLVSFITSGGENRPRNMAIRIWKRIV